MKDFLPHKTITPIFKTRADRLAFQLKTVFWLFISLSLSLTTTLLFIPIGHPLVDQQQHILVLTLPLCVSFCYFFAAFFWAFWTTFKHSIFALLLFLLCFYLLTLEAPITHLERAYALCILLPVIILNIWIGRQLIIATTFHQVQMTIYSNALTPLPPLSDFLKHYSQGKWKIYHHGAVNSRGVYIEQLNIENYERPYMEQLISLYSYKLSPLPSVEQTSLNHTQVFFIGYHVGLSLGRLLFLQNTQPPLDFVQQLQQKFPHLQFEVHY